MAEAERTREFLPNDIIEPSLSEREKKIDARIEELRSKREKFDPETEFVGIRRLGPSYTIAEPFAFFDGPSDEQLKYNRVNYMGLAGALSIAAVASFHKTLGYSYLIGFSRGLLASVPGAYLGDKLYQWRMKVGRDKHNIFFSYALIHENDFPKFERKKYDDVIRDFTAHRSMNMPRFGWRW